MTGLMWGPNECGGTKEGSLTYLERKGREGKKLRADGQVARRRGQEGTR